MMRRVLKKAALYVAAFTMAGYQFGLIGANAVHATSALPTLLYEGGSVTINGYPSNTVALSRSYFENDPFALTATGKVFAKGANYGGKFGIDPSILSSSETALEVPGINSVEKIGGTDTVGLAIKTDGTLWSWGGGQLIGRVTHSDESFANYDDYVPSKIPGLPAIQDVVAGADFVLALDVNGHVWSWGGNMFGQLGLDQNCPSPSNGAPYAHPTQCIVQSSIVPQQIAGLDNVTSISAGPGYSTALLSDGTVKLWGVVYNMEINSGYFPYYSIPTTLTGASNVHEIAASAYSLAVLTADGSVYSMGAEPNGLPVEGNNPYSSYTSLTKISSLQDIVSLKSGLDRAVVAESANGSLYRWGWDVTVKNVQYADRQQYAPVMIGSIGIGSNYYPSHNSAIILSQPSGDTAGPSFGSLSWANNPKTLAQTATLTVPVTDDSSGVAQGEYYLGAADPGQGSGMPMTLVGGNLTASFGAGLAVGVYEVNVRAKDNAGNWSVPTKDYLVVYDPNGPSVTGKKTTNPSLANGDVLPGLIQAGQTDKSNFAFTVKYTAQGTISSNSDLRLDYAMGTNCKKPSAVNCHTFGLNSTSIAWLVVNGTNQSVAMSQGIATLVIDGVTTTNPFKMVATDGSRLGANMSDHLVVYVYAPGANPATATPIYRVSDDVEKGSIRIR